MNIRPIFSDSMGVRSMATVIELETTSLFIDAAAALGPSRYGLPPHKIELETLNQAQHVIMDAAANCKYFAITHYHYDHHDPYASYYKGGTIFAKDISSNINQSQKNRGMQFRDLFNDRATLVYADGKTFEVDNHTVTFSPPFPHGPQGVPLGFVIMITITGDTTFLYASDVQGPICEKTKNYIIEQQPDIIIMDGPPSYFLGWKLSHDNLSKAEQNLCSIMGAVNCTLILDHHLLRDLSYLQRMPRLYSEYGDRIQTFAEFNGIENTMLEAHRKELWHNNNGKNSFTGSD